MYIASDETSTTHASANHIGQAIDQSGPTGSPVCTDDTFVKLARRRVRVLQRSHFCSNKIEKTAWPQIETREVTRTMTGVFMVVRGSRR